MDGDLIVEKKTAKRGRPSIYSSPEEKEEQTKAKLRAYRKKYYKEHKEEVSDKKKESYKANIAANHHYKIKSKYSSLSQQNTAITV